MVVKESAYDQWVKGIMGHTVEPMPEFKMEAITHTSMPLATLNQVLEKKAKKKRSKKSGS